MNALDFLLQVAIKATVLLAAAGMAALALRRASASARYLLWTCVLIAALLLPMVCLLAPRLDVARVMAIAPAVSNGILLVVTPATPTAPRHLPPAWPLTFWPLTLWMVGAAVLLVRLIVAHWRLQRRFAGLEAVSETEWRTLMAETAQRLRVRRSVALVTSAAVDVPLSFGLVRRAIVLPASAEAWTAERRQVVLIHELIHARRRDALWSLLAQLALVIHWFNPLAWLALSQFRREQERSCDDGVVASGIENTTYAGHLVDVARMAVLVAPGALGMAESFDLERRVKALLDPSRRRNALSRTLCASVAATVLAVLLPLAAIRAQAPATPGSLSGFVTDPTGAVVPHATVYLRNGEGGMVAINQSDITGEYTFRGISTGRYEVEARAPGFAPLRKAGISIDASTPARLNLKLDLGDSIESSIVIGTGPRPATPTVLSTTTPPRIRVGGVVHVAKLISKVNPVYPPDAEAEGVEGSVTMRAVISKTGNLLSVTSINSGVDARLARAAEDAVRTWQYEPTLLNGEPVEVTTTIAIAFRLKPEQ
jgi:TonB family protein